MYTPAHFAGDEDAVRALLDGHGAADLVTVTPEGLVATMLPFVHDPDAGERGALLGHVARNNPHWQLPTEGEALVIVRCGDTYVTPSWYASKAEHGRVVPTWNYVTAHVYGRLAVHDEPAWVEDVVRRLTAKHEAVRSEPWEVDDAPQAFVQAQLRAIVGVEVVISRVEAKFKLTQNKPDADIGGVIDGLEAQGDSAMAAAVRAHRPTGRRR